MTFKIKSRPVFRKLPLVPVHISNTSSSDAVTLSDIIETVKDAIQDMNRYHDNVMVPDEIKLEDVSIEAETEYDYDYSSSYIKILYWVSPSQRVLDEHQVKYDKKVAVYEKWKTDNADKIKAELERREVVEAARKEKEKIKRRTELEEQIQRAQNKLNSL